MHDPTLPGPDDELLARARAGDSAALSDVFAAHEPALLRMVELRFEPGLRGRLEPRDVVQEALIHALARFSEWTAQDKYPLHLWLRLLTAQTLAELRRRHLGAQKRDARRDIGLWARGFGLSSVNVAERLIASQTSPTEAARRDEVRARVIAAVDALDEIDREILVLRHFEGLTNDDAALELGIEPAAASKRYVRALARLRPMLAFLVGESDG